MRPAPRPWLALALTLATACRGLPDYRFEDEVDAGGAEVAAPSDATVPDPPDGAPPEARACPEAPPAFAQVCCGAVPCVGECASNCPACEARCGPDEACCAKRNTVLCRHRTNFVCN